MRAYLEEVQSGLGSGSGFAAENPAAAWFCQRSRAALSAPLWTGSLWLPVNTQLVSPLAPWPYIQYYVCHHTHHDGSQQLLHVHSWVGDVAGRAAGRRALGDAAHFDHELGDDGRQFGAVVGGLLLRGVHGFSVGVVEHRRVLLKHRTNKIRGAKDRQRGRSRQARYAHLIQRDETWRHGLVRFWIWFVWTVGHTGKQKGERIYVKLFICFLERRGWKWVKPFFAEEDLLQDAHLSVSLGQFLRAVGPGGNKAAGQRQRPRRCPGHSFFHGIVG